MAVRAAHPQSRGGILHGLSRRGAQFWRFLPWPSIVASVTVASVTNSISMKCCDCAFRGEVHVRSAALNAGRNRQAHGCDMMDEFMNKKDQMILANLPGFGRVYDCGDCGGIHRQVGAISIAFTLESNMKLVAMVNTSATALESWIQTRDGVLFE